MSMHLEGPWLSTTGKQKGKKKWASAEAKARAEALDSSWKKLLQRHNVEQEERKRSRGIAAESLSSTYSLTVPPGRSTTAHIKSVDTGGVATLKPTNVYTGTMVKGIATMHKSNAVPVFSDEQAVDISRMRR